jgi:FKBP-type peptidyl-prolyl cis-trans isomerase
MKSRRGDLLEITYEARIYRRDGPVFDSSLDRGTGQPYQFVLGSGDMIAGVDLGLYDMCAGEQRELDIPPALGFGANGNRLFGIPDGSRLVWKVELVSINAVREGDERTRDDLEGRFD